MSEPDECIEHPTQPKAAVVFILDVSAASISARVADGLRQFREEVQHDEVARLRVDLAIVTFGGSVAVAHEFSGIDDFEPSRVMAGGTAPMGEAVVRALDLIEQRKRQYRGHGIDYYRPWVFLVASGQPTDMTPGDPKWQKVVARVRDGESAKKFVFFAVGVEGANLSTLAAIAPTNRPPVKLVGTRFKEMFSWLSKSMAGVSRSKTDDQLVVDNPVETGWAQLPTSDTGGDGRQDAVSQGPKNGLFGVEAEVPSMPRVPVMFVVDVSESIAESVGLVNETLERFWKEAQEDDALRTHLDLALIECGETVRITHHWSSIAEFDRPTLKISNCTADIGSAILSAIDLVEGHTADYRQRGIKYRQPCVFLITAGEVSDLQEGSDRWKEVVYRIRHAQWPRRLDFCVLAGPRANTSTVSASLSDDRPRALSRRESLVGYLQWLRWREDSGPGVITRSDPMVPLGPIPSAWALVTEDCSETRSTARGTTRPPDTCSQIPTGLPEQRTARSTLISGSVIFTDTGLSHVLGSPIGRGAEGTVFTLAGLPLECAKVYARPMSAEMERKLRAMVRHPPASFQEETSGRVSLAWPNGLIFQDVARSRCVGFLMPRLAAQMRPAFSVIDPSLRQRTYGPDFTWKHLMVAARNIASLLAALHRLEHCVGDLSDGAMMVARDAFVALIDCDSYQVRDRGQTYRCLVGRPEYTAPELHGRHFADVDRSPATDDFALAVLVFQLLMEGTHPYQASGSLVEGAPDAASKIRLGCFPYGASRPGITPPRHAPSFGILSPELQELFHRCFHAGHENPGVRPTGEEWKAALNAAILNLRQCNTNAIHFFLPHTGDCPWCRFASH